MRGSYSRADNGMKQSLFGGGMRGPGLTVDIMDKRPKLIGSENFGKEKAGVYNCAHDVKPILSNPDTTSTVDSLERLPDTPVMHSIHARGRKAVRPTKFWTGSNADDRFDSLEFEKGREEEEPSSEEETRQISYQNQVSQQQPKHGLSFLTWDDNFVVTPPPQRPRDPQSTLQVTPRISRTVMPAMSRLRRSALPGRFNSPPKYSCVSHDVHSGPEDSGMVASNTAAARRNDKKLQSILSSTCPASKSPRSSLGSDRGGSQAIPEFSLWKKMCPGTDMRKPNPPKLRSSLISTMMADISPTTSVDESSTKATLSTFSPPSPEQSPCYFGDTYRQSPSEPHMPSTAWSSNPFATRAVPPQHPHVSSSTIVREGDSSLSNSSPYAVRTSSTSRSCITPSPTGSVGVMKLLQQHNASICNSGSGGGVGISRENNTHYRSLSETSSCTTSSHVSTSNGHRLVWSPLRNNKDLTVQPQDIGGSSFDGHGQRSQQHQKSDEKGKSWRRGVRSDDIIPCELDIEGYRRKLKPSSTTIDRSTTNLRCSSASPFGSPIVSSVPENFLGGHSSMTNEAMGIHLPQPIETQWKAHSTGFRRRSNERHKMHPHRRTVSSSGSKFQEVTSQYLKSDHQYSKSLSASLKSDHHRRSQSVQAASHFMIPHFSDNLSSRGVGTRSEPEEEVVTMRWKRGELLGEGRFGKVFLGLNEETGVLFAVKEIVLVDETDDEVALLQSEINTMKHLSHPNIGVAKLADFGCSKQLQGMHTQNIEDSSHAIRGSVPWMAPEVIKQTGHGRSADIWSVGATVIEMASASHPWPAFSNNLAVLFHVATASEPPPIPDELSEDARNFLHCCLCINPPDRWKADELAKHIFLSEDRKGNSGDNAL